MAQKYLYQKPPLPPLAYVKRPGDAGKPTVIFANGIMNDMDHKMVCSMERFFNIEGHYPFIKFDYSDTGKSVYTAMGSKKGFKLRSPMDDPSKFVQSSDDENVEAHPVMERFSMYYGKEIVASRPEDWSFYTWRKDLLKIIKSLADDEQVILVGYDIGAWIVLLAAMRLPQNVQSVICLSAQFDCFLRIYEMLNAEGQGKVKMGQAVYADYLYEHKIALNLNLVFEGKSYALLNMGAKLPVKCAVRFCHNINDAVSPYKDVVELAGRLQSADVQMVTVKDGTHAMTGHKDLAVVYRMISSLLRDDDLKQIGNRLDKEEVARLFGNKPKKKKKVLVSDSEAEVSDTPGRKPQAKTAEKYEELYRFPIPLRKRKKRLTKKWDFIVAQEMDDQKQKAAEREAGLYKEINKKDALLWMKEGNAKLDASTVRFLYRAPPLPALAYVISRKSPKASHRQPGIVYVGGFMNEMASYKAAKLEKYFVNRGYAFVRFDYTDHGMSNMEFHPSRPPSPVDPEDTERGRNKHKLFSFEQWRQDVLTAVDELTDGPQILIGYDMGAWLSVLAAEARPTVVRGVVALSGCVDFFERFADTFFTAEQQERIDAGQTVWVDGPLGSYVCDRRIIDSSRPHHLFNRKEKIGIKCPVRFCHGLQDQMSPYRTVEKLAAKLETGDVEVYYRKDGDHRLSGEKDYAMIYKTINDLLASIV